jgi:hypothetical protein
MRFVLLAAALALGVWSSSALSEDSCTGKCQTEVNNCKCTSENECSAKCADPFCKIKCMQTFHACAKACIDQQKSCVAACGQK